LVNENAQRRLEERVLEIAGKGPGRTTPDMIEVLEMAEEMGDKNAVWILREKFAEIGEMQARRSLAMRKNRTRRDEKEKRLENYVEANIQAIEQGLEFVGRQDALHSGRTDVTAIDAEGREAVIELKMNGYDPAGVSHQLMKYLGEKDESRLIFVAPEIRPELYFALKAAKVDDRISFMIVNQDGEDYSFEKFNGDFGEIQKIDFTRTKKDSDDDTVEIVRAEKAREVTRKRQNLEQKTETPAITQETGSVEAGQRWTADAEKRWALETEGAFLFSEEKGWIGVSYVEPIEDVNLPENWERWYEADRELIPGEVGEAILRRGYRAVHRRNSSLAEHSRKENLQGEYEGTEREFFFIGRDSERIDKETRRHIRKILKLINERVKLEDTERVYVTTSHSPDKEPEAKQAKINSRELALFRILKGMPTHPITGLEDLEMAVQGMSLFPKRYFEAVEAALMKASEGIDEEGIQEIVKRESELPQHAIYANHFFSRELGDWIVEKREVSRAQKDNLEKLADNSKVIEHHRKYLDRRVIYLEGDEWNKEKASNYITSKCTLEESAILNSADTMVMQLTGDRLTKVIQMISMTSNGFQSLNPDNPEWNKEEGIDLKLNFVQALGFAEQRLRELNGIIARYRTSKDVVRAIKILKRIRDESEGVGRGYAQNQMWFTSGLDCDTVVEEMRLKVQRTRALMEIDPRLAMLYMSHTDKRYLFYTGQVMDAEEAVKSLRKASKYARLRRKMIESDTNHYKSIINTFITKEMPPAEMATALTHSEPEIKSPEVPVGEAFLQRVLENKWEKRI